MGFVSSLISRNVSDGGHRTTMRLEPALWDGLAEVCQREGWTKDEAVAVASAAYCDRGLTSAVRTYLVMYFRAAAV